MAYEPFGGFGTSSSGNPLSLLRTSTPPKKKKKKKELTARQMALLLAAIEMDKPKSFGDKLRNAGKGALGGAEWALDKIMRPSWAVTAAADEAWDVRDEARRGDLDIGDVGRVAKAAKRGFTGKERKGFGEVLEEHDVLKDHDIVRGVAGLGLDIATDPLMLVTGGTSTGATASGKFIGKYAAAKGAGKAITKKELDRAAMEAGERALKGDTDDVLEEILTSAGPQFRERLALLKYNKEAQGVPAMSRTGADIPAIETRLAMHEARSFAEKKLFDPKKVALILGTQRHGLTVPLFPALTRPGRRIADKDIPLVSQLTDAGGKAFVPGFDDPIFRAGEMAKSHAAKHNALIARDFITDVFGDTASKLDNDKMLSALHLMEEPLRRGPKTKWQAVLKDRKTGKFRLNQKYLDSLEANGSIDAVQREFIEKYFESTSFLKRLDDSFGVPVQDYNRHGRMYVPHVLRPGKDVQSPTVRQQGLLTEAGYQKGRDATASLARIKTWVDEGEFDDIFETDVMLALWRRARAGAERQSDMALINALKASVGIPTRLVDSAKVSRAEARLAAAQAKFEGAQRLAASAEEAYHGKLRTLEDELEVILSKGEKSVRNAVKADAQTQKREQIQKLEKARRFFPEGTPRRIALEKRIKQVRHGRLNKELSPELEKEFKALQRQYDTAIKVLRNPRSKQHAKAVGPEVDTHAVAKSTLADAKAEVRSATSSLSNAKKGKANRAVNSREHTVINRAIDEFGHPMAFDRKTAAQIERLEKFITGQEDIVEEWTRGFGKVMGAWRILVTTVNPGYRVRNTMTDTWNMWLAGVPMHSIPVYFGAATGVLKRAKEGSPADLMTLQKAANHGMLSGLFAGDIQAVAQYIKHSGKTYRELRRDGKFIQLYTKAMQDFNRNAENIGRMAHYLYRTRALKESVAEAAHNVRIAHFDYEDLTKLEQDKMKKIFPFYTWTRKNIPYQLRQLATRPGRYSAFPKLAQESEYATTGGEEGESIPEYASEAFGFRIPFGTDSVYMPQFGVSDLEPFQGPQEAFQRVAAQVSPLYKVPAELALNRSAFTGAEIAGEHPRNPVTPFGAKVLGMIPGSNVGQTARPTPGGGQLEGPGANPYVAYVAGQIPMARLALVTGPGSITAQRNDNAAALSWLAGQSVVNADPELSAYYQYIELQDQVDKMIKGLRDEGVVARTTRKQTDFDKLIQKILKGDLNNG